MECRRFAKVKFLEGTAMEDSLPSGWDALNDEPSVDMLLTRLGKKRVPVKSVLLDQAVYAGIGNWCADDVRSRYHLCMCSCMYSCMYFLHAEVTLVAPCDRIDGIVSNVNGSSCCTCNRFFLKQGFILRR